MSEKSTKKPSSNRNMGKLRSLSVVCSLTSGWQQWVTDNEKKQSSEPSGWTPSSFRGPEEEQKKTWVSKKPPPEAPEEAPTSTPPDVSRTEELRPEPPPRIRTKPVVKTVTGGVQEKSSGVGLLTEKIQKEAPPSTEEMDKLLKKKSSPTRRRKCSNMVTSLTRSWRQEEAKDGGDGRTRMEEGGGQTEVEEKKEDKQNSNREEEEEMSSEEDSVRIKRPAAPVSKKQSEDATRISLSRTFSAVGSLKSRWQSWASEHSLSQKLNPFSEYFDRDFSMSLRLHKGQDGYGRPRDGSRTAERARRAEQHIHREILDMCYVIRTMADPDPDGRTRVTFGQLFDRYVRISDKVVGILMRARKHGKVAFQGEMLWQGQDDGVIITLLV